MLVAAALLGFAGGVGLLAGLFWGYGRDLPSVDDLRSYRPGLVTKVYDINDREITGFYHERREIVPLESIPRELKDAVISVEDVHFLAHRGIDPIGILRAMLANLTAGGMVQGGAPSPSRWPGRSSCRPRRRSPGRSRRPSSPGAWSANSPRRRSSGST